MPRIIQVSVPSLRVTLSSIFRKQGFNSTDALYLAGTLIDADQRGISSHGTQRMAMYDAKIRHRIIDPHARPGIVRSKGATLLIDAHAAMGQLAMREATNLAIGLAQSHGLGLVTVRNSNHFGTAGQYARKAADSGFIGVVSTNSNPIVAPTHTAVPALGSNPIAVAAGYGSDQLDFDAATSTVSLGKVEVHEKTNQPIASDWAIDALGNISHDPVTIMRNIRSKPRHSALTPLGGTGEDHGGYKGYGLGLAVELFTGLFGDAPTSMDLNDTYFSHSILVISPDAYGGSDALAARVSQLAKRLRSLPSSDGHPVLFPGDKERAALAQHHDTVPIDEVSYKQVRDIAWGLDIDEPQIVRIDDGDSASAVGAHVASI
ncbi:Ldh family oxidoreductase [Bifidobacterium apri]|uniref:Malate dehydrogenase n=1 Tax=Bifidobacterium apri TaxID=1769423 RepID=A0A6A2W502_9BIFI|nr:Ldh family oxidoreductase [Bifidobacterium apri]KAB8301955.1 malate dehydrogenase [Bifidobacterium apri]